MFFEFVESKKAFSLIEVLMVVFIMSVVFTTFYSVSTVGTKYIIESKNRLGAIAFVNEKMEIVRNLKYDDVGIQGGIPDGKIAQDEDENANGRLFHIHTSVQYEDDSLDGVFPADVIPNDYKTVKITVLWQDSNGQNQEVVSLSRFVPSGLETSVGGAPLAINIKGSDGVGVSQAEVHIVNNDIVPAVDFVVETNDDGHIMIPAAPTSLGEYRISISKNGYETVVTMNSPAFDESSVEYTPTYTHVSVLSDNLNMYDYISNKLANLTIKTFDYQNNPVGNLGFSLEGGKVLGRYASNIDVLNTHENGITDAITGQKKYTAISPGNYDINMDANLQYTFAENTPIGTSTVLSPNTDLTYEVKVVDVNVNGILVTVLDNDTSAPILDAKVSLVDSFGAEIFSDKEVSESGIAYYPDSATPLSAGEYTLRVEAAEYVTQEISVTVDKLTRKEIKLIKL